MTDPTYTKAALDATLDDLAAVDRELADLDCTQSALNQERSRLVIEVQAMCPHDEQIIATRQHDDDGEGNEWRWWLCRCDVCKTRMADQHVNSRYGNQPTDWRPEFRQWIDEQRLFTPDGDLVKDPQL